MHIGKMTLPVVRVNTFITETEKSQVDLISKMFIITEVLFGLNRLPLIGKRKFIYVFLTLIIYLVLMTTVFYMSYTINKSVTMLMWNKIIQNNICTVLSFTHCKWMLAFYRKLDAFDSEAACKPKISTLSVWNIAQAVISVLVIVSIYTIFPTTTLTKHRMSQQFAPLNILYVIEVHYFGHLLCLLVPRLKLINFYIESSLSSADSTPHPVLKEFVYVKTCKHNSLSQYQMRKLMDLYEMLVEAFDFFNEAIKWQFMVIILTAFFSILGFLFIFSLVSIRSGRIITDYAIIQIGMIVTLMAPLFAPCTIADRVHKEVEKLRELLGSKLYENKLDKSSRSVARILLAYTETKDLSFKLLRMLNINISLPFKFFALIVTYLIILLQFEKVINS